MSRDTRKEPPRIIERIFDVLEKDGTMSTNEIAKAINSNTSTVKKWVETIRLIQSKSRLIVESTARITLVRVEKEPAKEPGMRPHSSKNP